MKRKSNKTIIALVIFIILALLVVLILPALSSTFIPDYSVKNVNRKGCSIYFETLEKIENATSEDVWPIEEYEHQVLQIVVEQSNFNIESNKIKNWIEQGGQLVYLVSDDDGIDYGVLEKEEKPIKTYNYGRGKIITCPVMDITNKQIINDSDTAYRLLREIQILDYEEIVFNEYYIAALLNEPVEDKNLWQIIPFGIRLILWQILFVVIAYFCYKGKRFGKALVLYEETEREKNEYLYAAANLYRHKKCWDLAIENYYNYLLKKARQFDTVNQDLEIFWEKMELPHIEKVREVMAFIKVKDQKHDEKTCMKMIGTLEELIEIMDKRSELYWK